MCAQCELVVAGKARRLTLEVWLGDMRLTRDGSVAVRLKTASAAFLAADEGGRALGDVGVR